MVPRFDAWSAGGLTSIAQGPCGHNQVGKIKMARSRSINSERASTMGLSQPSLITFLLSFVIAMAVLFAKFFGATIPGLSSEVTQFSGVFLAYIILMAGCLARSF